MISLWILLFFACVGFSAETLHFNFADDIQLTWAIQEDVHAEWVHSATPKIDGRPFKLSGSAAEFNAHWGAALRVVMDPLAPIEEWKKFDRDLRKLSGHFYIGSWPEDMQERIQLLRDCGVKSWIKVRFDLADIACPTVQFFDISITQPKSIVDGVQQIHDVNPMYSKRLLRRLKTAVS